VAGFEPAALSLHDLHWWAYTISDAIHQGVTLPAITANGGPSYKLRDCHARCWQPPHRLNTMFSGCDRQCARNASRMSYFLRRYPLGFSVTFIPYRSQ
jgi:hypothetical protein